MNEHLKASLLLAGAVFFAALSPTIASAQDHPDEHRDQRPDEHRDDPHRDEHRDEHHDDPAERYRHDHPHASARCHDGFFTTTRDRDHACRRHGGIDVWLVL